jgi:hypothetical protein
MMPDACRAVPARRDQPLATARNLRRMITGIASGMALQAALPMVEAQEYELVPPAESGLSAERAITVRAKIDVLYFPPGGSEPILVQRAFETSAATNQSSQYVFDVLNNAALEGVNQALAGGAQTGRVNVVAICYSYDVDGNGVQSLRPMGMFFNTTDLNVMPNGQTALHSDIKVVPPNTR